MEATQSGITTSIVKFFNQVTTSGVIVGALIPLITLYINHLLSRHRAKEDRTEDFKLRLYELTIQAAQTANQYIFRLSKEQGILEGLMKHLDIHTPEVKKQQDIVDNLTREASDWIDGQVLILGETVNRKFYGYLNYLDSKYEKELREDIQKVLKNLIKKDFINLDEEVEKPKLYNPSSDRDQMD